MSQRRKNRKGKKPLHNLTHVTKAIWCQLYKLRKKIMLAILLSLNNALNPKLLLKMCMEKNVFHVGHICLPYESNV